MGETPNGEYYITLMVLHCGHGPCKYDTNVWYVDNDTDVMHEVELRHRDATGGYGYWVSAEAVALAYCEFYNLVPAKVT